MPNTNNNRQRFTPPDRRITATMGAAILRAAKDPLHRAWVTRRCMERLREMGLVTFHESIFKAGRLQYQVQLTNEGKRKASELNEIR